MSIFLALWAGNVYLKITSSQRQSLRALLFGGLPTRRTLMTFQQSLQPSVSVFFIIEYLKREPPFYTEVVSSPIPSAVLLGARCLVLCSWPLVLSAVLDPTDLSLLLRPPPASVSLQACLHLPTATAGKRPGPASQPLFPFGISLAPIASTVTPFGGSHRSASSTGTKVLTLAPWTHGRLAAPPTHNGFKDVVTREIGGQ